MINEWRGDDLHCNLARTRCEDCVPESRSDGHNLDVGLIAIDAILDEEVADRETVEFDGDELSWSIEIAARRDANDNGGRRWTHRREDSSCVVLPIEGAHVARRRRDAVVLALVGNVILVAVLRCSVGDVDDIDDRVVIAIECALVGDAIGVRVGARATCDVARIRNRVAIAIDEIFADVADLIAIAIELIWIYGRWAVVVAVGSAIAVGVSIGNAATADSWDDLQWVGGASIDAVGSAIAVGVSVGDSAAADSRNNLERVEWALIDAVWCAVVVGVSVCDAATTDSWGNLEWVEWAAILAINGSIAVGVGVGNAATADSRHNLEWIEWAAVASVDRAIIV